MATTLPTISDRTFEQRVEAAADTVEIFIFTLPWSGGSQLLKGIVSQLVDDYRDHASLGFSELDADNSPRTRSRYQIGFIPTTLVFRNGELVHQIKGVVSKHTFVQLIQPLLDEIEPRSVGLRARRT